MGWINSLRETYDNCSAAIGDYGYRSPLAPIYHTIVNADITITIDKKGEFCSCSSEDKKSKEASKEAVTIIPVTEDSASRTRKAEPHPLCDQLKYVAGDYSEYVDKGKNDGTHFNKYKELLEKWNSSGYGTEKTRAIYSYISKKSIVSDLVKADILKLDENGKLNDKNGGLFVRFKVIDPENVRHISETWKDKELFDSFIKFNDLIITEKVTNSEICYDTGRKQVSSQKHPKKIMNTAANAKLISANTKWEELVWGGRFRESNEAVAVSYETSRKIHNALTWIISNQGHFKGRSAFVCWSTGGKKLPDVYENDMTDILGEEEEGEPKTESEYADMVNKAIAGYRQNIKENDKVVMMLLEALTDGRMSIKCYSEFTPSVYFRNIKNWYENCSWEFKNKNGTYVSTPIPRQIAMAAYGVQDDGNSGEYVVVRNEKLERDCVERVVQCIIQGRNIPTDIVMSAVRNVSRPEAFNYFNHGRVIATTCAIIKIYYKNKGVEVKMKLDRSKNDRSYMYGRLLAVAEAYERSTYKEGENRTTNAERYWNSFVQKPADTWKVIFGRLRPYMDKSDYRFKYDKLLGEIHTGFASPGDFIKNEELSPMYLIGYWCQREDIYKKSENKEKQEDENQ